ncbi:Frizzled-2 [Amphibalanus amphitrite]|uniref:Frizzled-2 n=1 Tax=Amphibalanus amphitrite TaxID=1232801 RepID=A0A6A4UWN4_AMPAM|nr:Frizzled-2 [Amphibalanus amphitrite]
MLSVVLVSALVMVTQSAFVGTADQCEQITIRLCKDPDAGLWYNRTSLPNILGHETQDEAGQEVHQFFPLVKAKCSSSLQAFLCLVYAPECHDPSVPPTKPCRELCEDVFAGCEPLLRNFGFRWPARLECSSYPSRQSGEECAAPGMDRAVPTEDGGSPVTVPPPGPVTPSEQSCPCSQQTASAAQSAVQALTDSLERVLSAAEGLQQLQQETLNMQQANLRLETEKLELEIQLLRRRLIG